MLDENGMPSERVQAAIARIGIGSWNLEYVKVWSFAKLNNPEAGSRRYRSMHIPTSLTHERIMETIGGSSLISFWDMRRHIAQLESAGFSTRRALVWLQVELARPLFLATMVVIGAAFTMGSIRSGRTGLMVVFAIAFGFVLYFLQSFAVILGEIGQVPASLAAWASPLAGLLLAIGLILHLEDG